MDMAKLASYEHPARVLGVISGDGRGARAGGRAGRDRLGMDRRDRADPAPRPGGEAPGVGGAAAAAARLPRRGVVADRPARGPGGRPARAARAAPDHRLGDGDPRQGQGAAHPVPVLHARQHRPGLDPAHPVAGAAGRRAGPAPRQGHRRPGGRRADQPERGPAGRVADRPAQGARASARTPAAPASPRSPSRPRTARSASPGRTAGWRRTPPRATRTGRSRCVAAR